MSRNPNWSTQAFIGQRFGSLVVTEYVGKVGGSHRFKVHCDCGKDSEAAAGNIRRMTSCGCARGRHALDLTGQRFEDVVVVSRSHTNTVGHVVWRCVCKCDRVRYITGGYLRAGRAGKCFCNRITTDVLPEQHPLYHRWRNMVSRYQNGRKATGMVCNDWLVPENYINDVESMDNYEFLHHTNYELVRIDTEQPWSPLNVQIRKKWNTRPDRLLQDAGDQDLNPAPAVGVR